MEAFGPREYTTGQGWIRFLLLGQLFAGCRGLTVLHDCACVEGSALRASVHPPSMKQPHTGQTATPFNRIQGDLFCHLLTL